MTALSDALHFIETWLDHYFPYLNEPSLSLAITHKGMPVFARAWGYANQEKAETATPNHIYRMASHSKSFTAILVGMLVDENRLNLDEPISTYLPWTSKNKELATQTLRQILSHSTGMQRDGDDSSFWSMSRPFPTHTELQTYFQSTRPVIESNSRFKYSNTSYALAGMILEAVTGQSYTALATSRIFKPLGLRHTGTDNPQNLKNLCYGYSTLINGQRHPFNPMIAAQGLACVTGFHGTPTDFAIAFSNFILTNNLVSRKVQKELLHPVWPGNPDDLSAGSYCLGFFHRKYKNYNFYGHTGGYPGFSSRTFAIPSLDIAISMVINSDDGDTRPIAHSLIDILHLFLKERPAKNPLSIYDATFYTGRGFAIGTIAGAGKLLYVSLDTANPLAAPAHLIPTKAPHTFTISNVDGYSSFGEKATITLKQGKPYALQFASSLPAITDKAKVLKRLKSLA